MDNLVKRDPIRGKHASSIQASHRVPAFDQTVTIISTLSLVMAGLGLYFAPPGSAIAIGIACLIVSLIGIALNLAFGKRSIWFALLTSLITAVAAGFAGTQIHGLTDEMSVNADRSWSSFFVKITYPRAATVGSKFPQVACSQRISGSDKIPAKDTLVLGRRTIYHNDWYFKPVSTIQGNSWSTFVNFDTRNSTYELAVFAIPSVLLSDIDSLSGKAVSQPNYGWKLTNIPPWYTELVHREVRSSSPKSACS